MPSFAAWTPGSTRLVFERRRGGNAELVTYEVEGGKLEVQQTMAGNHGFAHLVVGAEHVAFIRSPRERVAQLVRSRLDGSELVELSPEGELAQYRRPRLSVDGKQVAYTDGTKIVRVGIGGGTATEVTTCASGDCEHAWQSNTGLLVRDGTELARHELDGRKTIVATEVLGFAVAGDPG